MLVPVLKVHITQGDHEGRGVIVSWVTPDEAGSTSVLYWAENSQHKKTVNGDVVRYKYYNYTSGYIHHCTINDLEVGLSGPLSLTDESWSVVLQWAGFDSPNDLLKMQFDTKYYYVVGCGNVTREFWFVTPPRPGPDVPYTFGLIGMSRTSFLCLWKLYIVMSEAD